MILCYRALRRAGCARARRSRKVSGALSCRKELWGKYQLAPKKGEIRLRLSGDCYEGRARVRPFSFRHAFATAISDTPRTLAICL